MKSEENETSDDIAASDMKAERRDLNVDVRVNVTGAELQAGGLVVVAHRSGGVGMDIVDDGRNGCIADDVTGYGEAVAKIVRMGETKRAVPDSRNQSSKMVSTSQWPNLSRREGGDMNKKLKGDRKSLK